MPSALTSSPGLGAGQVPGSAEDTGQVAAVHRWALPGCQRRAPPCGLLGSISAPWVTLCARCVLAHACGDQTQGGCKHGLPVLPGGGVKDSEHQAADH